MVRAEFVQFEPETTTSTFPRRYSFYSPELQLLAETSFSEATTPTIDHEYVWFGGEPVAQIETATSTIHYYFNDHLGAPLLTTNSTGVVDWRVEREPYGSIFATRAGPERHQPLSLPGQEYDPNQPERAYNVFRWYRSSWGRYTQRDPMANQKDHLYAYVLGNPLRLKDPLGLFSIDPSCDALQCIRDNSPYANRREAYRQEGTGFCLNAANEVTDVALRTCIQGRCESGVVKCGDCNRGDVREAEARSGDNFITICMENQNKPWTPPPGVFGTTIFHEFAHTCGWEHGERKGTSPCWNGEIYTCIPGDPKSLPGDR